MRKKLNAALVFLSKRVIIGDCTLWYNLFNLEFGIVSPLYYRLQRHLIDWGTLSHHPQLNELKSTQVLDEEALLR